MRGQGRPSPIQTWKIDVFILKIHGSIILDFFFKGAEFENGAK